MTPEVIELILKPFAANGLIGSICIVLGFFIVKMRTELRDEQSAHKVELAAKDALIKELYDARIVDAQVGYDIVRANEKTADALLAAIGGATANGRMHQ